MSNNEEVKKEQTDEKVEHINLKFANGNGEEISFKIKKTTPLSKLMTAYETKAGIVNFLLIKIDKWSIFIYF